MRKLTSDQKTALFIFVAVLISLGIGVVNLKVLDTVISKKDAMGIDYAQRMIEVEKLRTDFERKLAVARGFLLSKNKTLREETFTARRLLLNRISAIEKMVTTDEGKDFVRRIKTLEQEHHLELRKLISMSENGAEIPQLGQFIEETMMPKVAAMDRLLKDFVEFEHQLLQKARADSVHAAQRGRLLVTSLLILVTAGLAAIGWLIRRSFQSASLAEKTSEAALTKESLAHRRFTDLVNHLDHSIVWEADAKPFKFNFISDRLQFLLGIQAQELIDDPELFFTYTHPEDRKRLRTMIDRVISERRDARCEHRMSDVDGKERWMQTGIHRRRQEDGKDQLYGLSVDITPLKKTQFKLGHIQERFDLALSQAEIGVWEVDLISGVADWTAIQAKLFGLPPGAPKSLDEVIQRLHPDDRGRVQQLIEDTIANEDEYSTEFRLLWPDGSLHWIKSSARVVRDDKKKALRLLGVDMDITAQKNLDDRLRAEQKKMTYLFEQAPAHILVLSGPEHRIEMANSKYLELIGGRDVVGRKLAETLRRPGSARFLPILDEIYRSGKPYVGKEVKSDPVDGPGEPSQCYYFDFVFQPIREFDGAVTGIFIFGIEVTDKVLAREAIERSEHAIRQSEEQFRTLANSIPQMAFMADKEGFIFWFNQRWYDFTGSSFEEVRGMGWTRVHDPEHVERVKSKYLEAIRKGEPWEDTFPLLGKNGEWRWFLSRALPIRDRAGNITMWFGTNTDVTERRSISEELKSAHDAAQIANRAKSEFLANMSHEIRTPMNSILGFADLLRDPDLPLETRQNYLEKIIGNGDLLLHIIDDILNLSKFESGQIPLEKTRFPILDLVSEALDGLKPLADAKKLALKLEFAGPVPKEIHSDPLRLRQVLLNLVGNAVKFTEMGSVSIRLKLLEGAAGAHDKHCLEIEVADTGIGIAQEQKNRLFKPFSQADTSVTRRFGGTGLGLVLSKRLAQAMGGNLTLRSSEPGQGSRFVLTIPTGDISQSPRVRVPPPPPELKRSTQAGKKKPGRLNDLHILLAEDSPDNEMLVRLYLEHEGAEIQSAQNGLEALELVASEGPFDVILMDIQMPVMDGLEASKRLRAQGYRGPIIALTAHALREEIERSLQAGCDTHLTKPIQRERLVEEILWLLGRRKSVFHQNVPLH